MSSSTCSLAYVKEQLDELGRTPSMWGPPLAIELQYQQLLEFYLVVAKPRLDQSNPRYVRDLYAEFQRSVFPELGARPLSFALAEPMALVGHLSRFRTILQDRVRPANPFEDYDLCWLVEGPLATVASEWLGAKVHVRGKAYKKLLGRTVVIVEDLQPLDQGEISARAIARPRNLHHARRPRCLRSHIHTPIPRRP